MSKQYRLGDQIQVRVCTGIFDVEITRVRPPIKSFNAETTYECATRRQPFGTPRHQLVPQLTTTVSARSIVGSDDYNTTDCTIDCPFYTDECTGVKA